MLSLKRFIAVGAAVVTMAGYSILQPCSARADDEGAIIGDVTVTAVAATPARTGETTIITFSVENAGIDHVLITGLRLPGGEPSRVMGAFGQGHSGEIGALSIQAGGAERLDGAKAWIEVGPLTQDLQPDTTVPARLLLGTYESPLTLHVGPVATGTLRSSRPTRPKIADRSPAQPRDHTGC